MSTSSDAHPTSAQLAAVLAQLADDDRRLARALTVHETWGVGYVSGIIDAAAILAAHGPAPADATSTYAATTVQERARAAVEQALDEHNPRMVLDSVTLQPYDTEVDALVAMLYANAAFLSAAIALERRGLRRIPLPR